MGMQELTLTEIQHKLRAEQDEFALFLFSPLCGTCQVTHRMLDIVLQMEPELPVYKGNLNLMSQLSDVWQITSIPCIVILKNGNLVTKFTRMESVERLLSALRPMLPKYR
ncbi:thioredoxin family protein [Paenibacillus sp. N1-5-1-14]|uniref:thioredoxin family protein n=1 Tax=Paenibacillus radicibacter TaxID=2972488 RepID=UPI002158DA22|nr:thioredoxin family protein [Paenibacillus radicibacter]MCR8641352.1 thioredoxin family protein [Paenibacillus radicibacter]